MKVKFDVRITEKELFSFLLNNTYRKPMGVIMFVFGIVCFVVAAVSFKDMGVQSTCLLVILGSLYTIVNPILLKKNAHKQFIKNPVYQAPLTYELSDEGVTVSQNGETTSKNWDEFWKARDYGKTVVLYIMVNNGIIIPKEALGTDYNKFVDIVSAHLKSNLKKKAD